jgi:hypothetical protein
MPISAVSRVRLFYLVTAAAATAALVSMYFHFKPEPAPTGVHIEARPAPEVAKVDTVPLPLDKPLKVYKPAAKKKLALPESVQADPDKHVVASTKTADDGRTHTVTTVIDAGTGETTTYDRADPLPWVAVKTTSQVGAFYGLKNGYTAFRIEGQQEVLQIKAVHLGAVASVDIYNGQTDTFAGVGAWVRW